MIECYCSFCQSEIDPRSTICTGNTVFALLFEKRARSLFTLEFQNQKRKCSCNQSTLAHIRTMDRA